MRYAPGTRCEVHTGGRWYPAEIDGRGYVVACPTTTPWEVGHVRTLLRCGDLRLPAVPREGCAAPGLGLGPGRAAVFCDESEGE
jgi:hypothetical protein